MLLTKNGVTFDVSHPSDIQRLKSIGFSETKPVKEKPEGEKGKGNKKGEEGAE